MIAPLCDARALSGNTCYVLLLLLLLPPVLILRRSRNGERGEGRGGKGRKKGCSLLFCSFAGDLLETRIHTDQENMFVICYVFFTVTEKVQQQQYLVPWYIYIDHHTIVVCNHRACASLMSDE